MENELLIFTISVFTGLFAVMNPLTNLPIFVDLIEGADRKTMISIARKGTFTAFIIITIFVLFGKFIFDIFNLTIPAFKMTGGLLLFHLGYEMLQSKKRTTHSQNSVPVDNGIAISPLAIPILAGPGTIVTAMNFTTSIGFIHIIIIIIVFAFIAYLTYLTFITSEKIIKVLGKNIIEVVSKLMGLILAIMGMDMVNEGIKLAFQLN